MLACRANTTGADGDEEDDPHPAILDRLAFVALRRGQFSEAQTLYGRVLERNEFDASARFGLGRVYFEEGTTQWRLAFEEWLHALRLRAKGDKDRDQSIYGVLGISESPFDVRELDRYVSWCWRRGVDADYLAGAKGAYSRALLRMRHRGVDVEQSLQRDWLTSFESSLEPRLRDLYEHIRGTADSQTYYRDADILISTIDSEQAVDWSAFVTGLVRGVAGTAWRAGERLEDTLAKVVPAKRICSLADLVNARDGTTAVGGLVDSDALIAAERRYFGSRWHVAGSRIERSILGSIPEGRLAFAFGKFGVFFTSEPGHNGSGAAARCFVEVMPSDLARNSIPDPEGSGVSLQSIIT